MPLENQEVKQGDKVKFLCQVITHPDEIDKVHIRWKFNEETIKPSSSSKFNIIEDGETLIVRNVQKSEEGDYTCVASIRGMKDRSTARLIVKSRCSSISVIGINLVYYSYVGASGSLLNCFHAGS